MHPMFWYEKWITVRNATKSPTSKMIKRIPRPTVSLTLFYAVDAEAANELLLRRDAERRCAAVDATEARQVVLLHQRRLHQEYDERRNER